MPVRVRPSAPITSKTYLRCRHGKRFVFWPCQHSVSRGPADAPGAGPCPGTGIEAGTHQQPALGRGTAWELEG